MAVQKISSIVETIMVLFPSLINLGIIIYSLYLSKRSENFNRIWKKVVFIIFYIIILITFSISVIITVLLYLDITPKMERFL